MNSYGTDIDKSYKSGAKLALATGAVSLHIYEIVGIISWCKHCCDLCITLINMQSLFFLLGFMTCNLLKCIWVILFKFMVIMLELIMLFFVRLWICHNGIILLE